MSTAWIWTIWTVLMILLSYVTVVYDLGAYELPIFMIGALVLSAATFWYERRSQASEQRQ